MKTWDDISYMNGYGRWIWIDRRSNYIIHFNGSIRYDFSRFSTAMDAVLAEYKDFGADALQEALLCVFSDLRDAKDVFIKMQKRGEISPNEKWNDEITYESTYIPKPEYITDNYD